MSSSTENNVAGMTGWKPSGSPVARPAVPAPPSGPVRPPTVARERKPALAALAFLLIAAGVLASVYLQMQAGNRVGVIQVTQRVAQGQQLTSSDITEVMVAQDSSVNYVTWSQRGLLTKYTTVADLVPGTILIGQMLTTSPASNGSTTVMAVKLGPGQYPPTISIGEAVDAYYVGSAQNAGGSATSPTSNSSGGTSAGANSADVSIQLSTGVKIVALPSVDSTLGGSSSNNGVFTVSVNKADVNALLTASAEGDLVFTSGAGS